MHRIATERRVAYWLMKSEPDVFSWDDLVQRGAKGEPWNGVRNHTAKLNLMKMRKGERFVEEGVFIRPFGAIIYLTPAFTIGTQELSRLTGAIVKVVGEGIAGGSG